MGKKKIKTIVEEKIHPFSLNEVGIANINQLEKQYPYDMLKECIEIGVSRYFRYDGKGELTKDSVDEFLNKIGGIAYNKSLSPIDQEIKHVINTCRKRFRYLNEAEANKVLAKYVDILKLAGWTDSQIVYDLKTDGIRLCCSSKNFTEWSSEIDQWIKTVDENICKQDVIIKQDESILPRKIFERLPGNLQSLCKQINASYEHNLYDCTAVIMRRLLEVLLILCYQNNGIEKEIIGGNGYYYSLDKIIKNVVQNKKISLSVTCGKDMERIKDLGNYSAHKIWFNTTRKDIEPHVLQYRVIIEELIYKANLNLRK